VAHYLTALSQADTHALEDVWPGQVVVYDPHETIASTVVARRAVVELVAHVDHKDARLAWPVADGAHCALEYNCTRWGTTDMPPQAGLGVYERSPDGLLAAARVYDDVEGPVGHY
jgi:hypothetical protein